MQQTRSQTELAGKNVEEANAVRAPELKNTIQGLQNEAVVKIAQRGSDIQYHQGMISKLELKIGGG